MNQGSSMPNPSSSMLEPRFDHARDWFEEARIKVRACSDQFEHSRTKVRACSNQGFGSEGPGLVLGFRWVYEVLRLSTHIKYVRVMYVRSCWIRVRFQVAYYYCSNICCSPVFRGDLGNCRCCSWSLRIDGCIFPFASSTART